MCLFLKSKHFGTHIIVMHPYVLLPDDKVNFANGLSDINALRGKSAELVCTLNTDNADGVWYKNGVKVQYVCVS